MPTIFPLVSTAWLGEHLHDPNIVILESSVFLKKGSDTSPIPRFRSGLAGVRNRGRIPGARFADLFVQFSDPDASLPFTRPTRDQFNLAAGALGITPEAHVVIYDRLAGQWASRLWWVFRSFGHHNVTVLDGGLKKFEKEGKPIENGKPHPSVIAAYQSAGSSKFVAFQQDVKEIVVGRRQGSLVCLLKSDDYSGAISVREPRWTHPWQRQSPVHGFAQ